MDPEISSFPSQCQPLFFPNKESVRVLNDSDLLADVGVGDASQLLFPCVPNNAGCFRRDSTALVLANEAIGGDSSPAELMAGSEVRSMESLRAGDKVLVADPLTGEVYVDRVSINLHVRDTFTHSGVTLTHTNGEVSVTDEHMMLLADGTVVAANNIKVGDMMLQLDRSSISTSDLSAVRVIAISRWEGGIINPLTHSGRILAGGAAGDSGSFVLATTVFASPGGVLLTMATMPSFFKLGSLLFPEQLQDSRLVEWSSNVVAGLTLLLYRLDVVFPNILLQAITWSLSIACFAVLDLVIGLAFVAYHTMANSGTHWLVAIAVFLWHQQQLESHSQMMQRKHRRRRQ